MSELFVVRHGQASFGAKNYDKLSTLGLQQSHWLGEYFQLRNMSFSHLWMGDLVRHRETAQGIVSQLSQPVGQTVTAELNEFDFQVVVRAYLKIYPHHTLASDAPAKDFYRLLKMAMVAWSQGQLAPVDLFESWDEFRQRVVQAMLKITQSEAKSPVLLVTSGGVIAMLMSIVLGVDASQVVELNLQIRNSSFSHFYFNKERMRLSSFNNITHLDSPERMASITFS